MKKLISILFLLFAVVSLNAQVVLKTVNMAVGQTFLSITNTAANVVGKDSTKYIVINCSQDYPQQQDVVVNMTTLTGSPSVQISLVGRKFLTDTWTEVISQQTWTTTAIHLTSTVPTRYRQYAIKFVGSSAAQTSWPSTCQFKVWFEGPTITAASLTDGTATFTGGALTGVTTIDASGAVTVGGALGVTGATTAAAVTASGLITANGGVTLGGSDNLVGSATSDIVFNTNKFTVAGATGNTLVAGTLAVTGAQTNTAAVTANGGVVSTLYNFASATVVGGSADAWEFNFTPDFPALAAGLCITFIAEAANTGAVTLAIDGGTAKAVGEYNGAYGALDANDVRSGQVVTIVYDGTQWVMMSPSGN